MNYDSKNLLVDDSELHVLKTRPKLRHYLGEVLSYRHFVSAYARSGAFANGRDTFLGKIWLILDPLMQVSIYVVVFGLILNASRGMDNYVGFLALGVVFFRFLSKGLNSGALVIQKSRGLISTFNFPRAAIPISVAFRDILDSIGPGILATAVAVLLQLDGVGMSYSLIILPVIWILLHIFTTGLTLITARLTAFVPDFRSLINLTVRGLFFVSGVFFSMDRFPEESVLRKLVEFNPFFRFLDAVRSCVLDGSFLDASTWFYLVLSSSLTLLIGFVFFWQGEPRYSHVR